MSGSDLAGMYLQDRQEKKIQPPDFRTLPSKNGLQKQEKMDNATSSAETGKQEICQSHLCKEILDNANRCSRMGVAQHA